MYTNQSANIHIQTLYSWGGSYLSMSYYMTYLVIKLVPCIGVNRQGFARYSDDIFISTSIDRNGAALFISLAAPLLSGKDLENPVQAVLPCNNGASLDFEIKPDENKQTSAYLIARKGYSTIPFKFASTQSKVYENGKMTTKTEHVDLGIFIGVLEGYLKGSGQG